MYTARARLLASTTKASSVTRMCLLCFSRASNAHLNKSNDVTPARRRAGGAYRRMAAPREWFPRIDADDASTTFELWAALPKP